MAEWSVPTEPDADARIAEGLAGAHTGGDNDQAPPGETDKERKKREKLEARESKREKKARRKAAMAAQPRDPAATKRVVVTFIFAAITLVGLVMCFAGGSSGNAGMLLCSVVPLVIGVAGSMASREGIDTIAIAAPVAAFIGLAPTLLVIMR